MPDGGEAQSLKSTLDDYGTGNISELRSRRVPAVDWTGRYYTSSLADLTVVNAQAEPVGQGATAARLAEISGKVVTEAE